MGWRRDVRWLLVLAALGGGIASAAVVSEAPPGPLAWCSARFSRIVGGTGEDWAYGAAVDTASSTYVTGMTSSSDFPVSAGAFDTTSNGLWDTFVVKLGPTGSIVYATYLGGTSHDSAYRIAVDGQGSAFVAGTTSSTDYPVTAGSFDPTFNGVEDAFVTKLRPDGSGLVYSTFVGGSSNDTAWGIALDCTGRAHFGGTSRSFNYPTTPGAYGTVKSGGDDVVITALSPAGDGLVFSTFVGGSQDDIGWCIAVDASGSAHAAGATHSQDFPTTPGAAQPSRGGGTSDAFVVKLSPSGASLAFGTYLGGTVNEDVWALAVDASGAVLALGRTDSPNFPVTPGAFDVTYNGNRDVFLAKLAAGGGPLLFSTFLGGASPRRPRASPSTRRAARTSRATPPPSASP